MKLPNLENVDLAGKKVLLRLALNVPIKDGEIEDPFRIDQSIPTIELLRDKGAKIIIISHIWGDEITTLEPVYEYLKTKLDLTFSTLDNFEESDIVLLENLRLHEGEMENNIDFAKKLASLGDYFVNDSFSVSHRKHASIVGVSKFLPSFAGPLFEKEFNGLSKVFDVKGPSLFILGGAKFETKLPLIKNFLSTTDNVFVGGALANDFFKARGYEVGQSLISGEEYHLRDMNDDNLILPTDVYVRNGEERILKRLEEVGGEDNILDIGEESLKNLNNLISAANLIVWNGPLGDYEKDFGEGTEKLAHIISDSKAHSVIGGGDTLAVVDKLNLKTKFNFISTAGGAMLEFLSKKTLPGIEALSKQSLS